jgi:hypothetical protein
MQVFFRLSHGCGSGYILDRVSLLCLDLLDRNLPIDASYVARMTSTNTTKRSFLFVEIEVL